MDKNKHWMMPEEKAFIEWVRGQNDGSIISKKEFNFLILKNNILIKMLLDSFYAGIKYEQSLYNDDLK